MKKIYLDYNASTPIAPKVSKAMKPFITDHYGNPSSHHWAGLPAKEAVEKSRSQIAGLLGCLPSEIVFTSGGTESNNHAIKGIFHALRERGNHIITSTIEHPAVIEPCHFLKRLGADITVVGVDGYGLIDPDAVRRAITKETILISIMHANNEVGTIQPIADIAKIAHEHGITVHTDAAQSIGKIPTKVSKLGVDLLTVAGHKVYAPKGVGALYIKQGTKIEPMMHGAGHESGRRAGTENVLLNVGLGMACEIAESWTGMSQVKELRDRFWEMLHEEFGERVVLNGHPTERLSNTLNISFVNKVGSEILSKLDGVAASTGSACHEGSVKLSPVLAAMGVSPQAGMGAIRFSLGRNTTMIEIDSVVNQLKEIWITRSK